MELRTHKAPPLGRWLAALTLAATSATAGGCFPSHLADDFAKLTAELEEQQTESNSSSTGASSSTGVTTSTVTGNPLDPPLPDGNDPPRTTTITSLAIAGCADPCTLYEPTEITFKISVEGHVESLELRAEGERFATLSRDQGTPGEPYRLHFEHRLLITAPRDLVPGSAGKDFKITAQVVASANGLSDPETIDLRLSLPAPASTIWTWHGDPGTALAAAVDPAGDLVVVGRHGLLPNAQIAVRKFAGGSGQLLWERLVPGKLAEVYGWNAAHGVAIADQGEIYVVGQRVLQQGETPRFWAGHWDSDGLLLGEHLAAKPGSSARGVLLQPETRWMPAHLVIVGSQTSHGLERASLWALRLNLDPLWGITPETEDPTLNTMFTSVTAEPMGDLLVGGAAWLSGESRFPLLGRYEPNGDVVWSKIIPGGPGRIDAVALALGGGNSEDGEKTALVTIGERQSYDKSMRLQLLRYDIDGNEQESELRHGQLCDDERCALTIDPVGRQVIGGAYRADNRDIFIHKGDPHDLTNSHWQLRVAGEDGGDDHCHTVVSTPEGRIYAAGDIREGGIPEWWVTKLNP